MKLSLDEKTLIIIGIFTICLLFLYNLKEDDKKFYKKNIVEEESREIFQDTPTELTTEATTESIETAPNKEQELNVYQDFEILNKKNKDKITEFTLRSKKYYNNINTLKNNNKNEMEQIQNKLIKNLITGEKEELHPEKNYNSILEYNGNLLRNSLLSTAVNF